MIQDPDQAIQCPLVVHTDPMTNSMTTRDLTNTMENTSKYTSFVFRP